MINHIQAAGLSHALQINKPAVKTKVLNLSLSSTDYQTCHTSFGGQLCHELSLITQFVEFLNPIMGYIILRDYPLEWGSQLLVVHHEAGSMTQLGST